MMLTDDDGAPLYEDDVMATCGTGCWGDWQTEVSYTVDREQFGALIVGVLGGGREPDQHPGVTVLLN